VGFYNGNADTSTQGYKNRGKELLDAVSSGNLSSADKLDLDRVRKSGLLDGSTKQKLDEWASKHNY
jgi:hypothetical protein